MNVFIILSILIIVIGVLLLVVSPSVLFKLNWAEKTVKDKILMFMFYSILVYIINIIYWIIKWVQKRRLAIVYKSWITNFLNMKITDFNKGIISSSLGSFWWGFIGTYYFQYITFVGTIEVVVHRCIWTSLMLLITTTFFNKWHLLKKIIFNKKKLLILLITSILIFGNWSIWIYAVATNRIIDASFGYFIFPIISVFFGFLFFNEK